MSILKKAWDWLVKSSADANKTSLTVKAFLYGVIPAVVYFLGLTGIQVGSETLTEIVNIIAELIVVAGGAITAIAAVWGVIRKLFTTAVGTNDVVLGWSEDEY